MACQTPLVNRIAARCRVIVTTALLAMAASLVAGDTFQIKVYSAPRLEGMTLDGDLAEPSWQNAPLAGGFTLYGKETKAPVQTFFRVGYDDSNLYVGVVCEEPDMKHVAPMPQSRDAHAIFSGETVEVFVDPEHSHSLYYQFAVNAAASMYDSRGQDPIWSADIRSATSRQDTSWSLELAIPWSDLGVKPEPGRLLGFNVCRDRQLGGKQWTNWARVISGFHDPVRFAHLVLEGTPEHIAAHSREFRKGNREGPLVVYTSEGVADTTYRALAQASLIRLQEHLALIDAEKARETNDTVRRELERMLDDCRQQIKPIQNKLTARQTLDARQWSQIDQDITDLLDTLGKAIWNARLNALLKQI